MDINLIVATFSFITPLTVYKPIQIVSNNLDVQVDYTPKKSPKYKKVGKNSKAILLQMVDSGSSIVSASTKLGINYSTAKSIIQARNKELSLKVLPYELTDDSNERKCPKKVEITQ